MWEVPNPLIVRGRSSQVYVWFGNDYVGQMRTKWLMKWIHLEGVTTVYKAYLLEGMKGINEHYLSKRNL